TAGVILLVMSGASSASAQSIYDPYAPDMMLVAPDGAILDYIPEQGEVVVRRDRSGRRILIDHYGNVVATEIPRDGYSSRSIDRYPPPPGNYRRYRDTAGYRDYREYRPGEPGEFTGTVPHRGSITRLPLDDHPYPAMADADDDYAAISPDQTPDPALEDQSYIIASSQQPHAEHYP